jgi:hypothetical protein
MTIKRRRVQAAPKQPAKPAPAPTTAPSPAPQAEQPSHHELPEDAFAEELDASKPLDDTQRFFITLGVVAVLFILVFAVLQSF